MQFLISRNFTFQLLSNSVCAGCAKITMELYSRSVTNPELYFYFFADELSKRVIYGYIFIFLCKFCHFCATLVSFDLSKTITFDVIFKMVQV